MYLGNTHERSQIDCMKTNKRDKGIKGKPTQDINTCNKFYYEVLRDYTSTITQYTERIYLTKSEKKAMKLINSCRKQGIDPNTSYCLIKIEV